MIEVIVLWLVVWTCGCNMKQYTIHQKTKRKDRELVEMWTFLLLWKDLELFTKYGWLIADLQWNLPIDQVSSPVLICDAKTWSTKKQRGAFESCFGNWTVLLGWSDLEPCTRDDVTKSWPTMSASPIKSLPQSWSVMLRLGPPKNKEKCVKVVLETGLTYCVKQILNCAQEMGN